MTALDIERMTKFAGVIPSRGTFGIKANKRIFKGGLTGIDSAGRAMPGDTIANGCLSALGKSSATYDNRNGSELGGSADACNVEIEYGVFGFDSATGGGDDITADDVGKVCFVVDDHTVALTNGTDTRGIAGLITEVRDGKVYVWMGPHVVALIVIAASEASQLDTAQTDIDALELRADALETDATTSQAQVNIPLTSFVDPDGDPLAKYVADTTDGYNLADSEAFGLRWNNAANPTVFLTSVAMPQDYDDTAAVVIHFLASKIGATAADTPAFVVTAFSAVVGAAYDADSDFGGTSSAMTNAGTKVVQEVTLSLASGDVPAAPTVFTLTVVPNDMAADDVVLHGIWLEYTRKQMTS